MMSSLSLWERVGVRALAQQLIFPVAAAPVAAIHLVMDPRDERRGDGPNSNRTRRHCEEALIDEADPLTPTLSLREREARVARG